jgi:hypothetical protein
MRLLWLAAIGLVSVSSGVSAQSAMIVLVRPCVGVEGVLGPGVPANLIVDGKVIASTLTCNYTSARVSAGTRQIDIRHADSFFPRLVDPPTFKLAAGQTIYFTTYVVQALQFRQISTAEGQALIASLRKKK